MRKDYLQRIEEIAKKACLEHGVSLYDVEEKETTKGLVILVYINKLGGISVDDCTLVSKSMDLSLEEMDFVGSSFMLEVSSPGIERDLKFKKHYVSAINEMVKIEYDSEAERKTVIGILEEVSPETIKVRDREETMLIFFESIHKARTYFDFKMKGSGK
ncbi:MAG: ribosome assembly cofactor RimP [Candidatus Cloacimonetes bacterium]|nr:ribosome assembly cofactor RimP [Candidatus Cloacimonadota bacterium]